ncbi:MAG: GIY-YIG nuclease family protein [Mariprofundaceae bacterium]
MSKPTWFVYLVRTAAGHLYTGISTDVERRFSEHAAGKGAKYLRGKGPLELVFQKHVGSRADALKLEAAIKKMSKCEKEAMLGKPSTNGE